MTATGWDPVGKGAATRPAVGALGASARCPLRVGLISPPWFSVPPTGYGGIESVCAGLVNGLSALGHDVLLIGAGSDLTAATFAATYGCPPSDRIGESVPEVVHAAAAARLLAESAVDVVHDHSLAGPLSARGRFVPTVVTAHGPATGELGRYYRELGDTVSLVAISEAQRERAPNLPWVTAIHNGIDVTTYPFQPRKEDYLLFLGRMCAEKGVHHAIDAARAADRRIIVAGKCREPAERAYFAAQIEPRLGPGVTFIGEADAGAKRDLLAHARCLLFPICWEEPFGMVMIEAMACGTPVVALRRGSVSEVVVDGVTGYICDEPDDLAAAVSRVDRLAPADCRAAVEERFSTSVMARRYEAVYRSVVAAASPKTLGFSSLPRALSPRAKPTCTSPADGVGPRR